MMRTFVSAVVAVVFLAGVSLADEKKTDAKAEKAKTVRGQFVKMDEGKITIKQGRGDDAKEMTYTVSDECKVVTFKNREKKELTGDDAKKALKGLKEKQFVSLTLDKDGKTVTSLTMGSGRRGGGGGRNRGNDQ